MEYLTEPNRAASGAIQKKAQQIISVDAVTLY
jgi:hypothetical protein